MLPLAELETSSLERTGENENLIDSWGEEIEIQWETESWGLLNSGPMNFKTVHLYRFWLYKVWGRNLQKHACLEYFPWHILARKWSNAWFSITSNILLEGFIFSLIFGDATTVSILEASPLTHQALKYWTANGSIFSKCILMVKTWKCCRKFHLCCHFTNYIFYFLKRKKNFSYFIKSL